MTKSDLVPGKTVVEFRNGEKALRLGCGFVKGNGKSAGHASHIREDLTSDVDAYYDIVATFQVTENGTCARDLAQYIKVAKEVWRRNDNQEEYDKLMKQIESEKSRHNKFMDELKDQAEKLRP